MNADECRGKPSYQRIAVVGTTGSGMTTLVRRLAQFFGIPHVELDALYWGPDWTPVPTAVFRERTAQVLSGDRWVVDSNQGKVRDIIWGWADTVVWPDYALPVILGQLVWRTLRRIVTREELSSGSRERLRAQLGRDSVLLWALRTYRRRREEYPALLNGPEYAHLAVIHLRSPRATNDWLSSFTRPK